MTTWERGVVQTPDSCSIWSETVGPMHRRPSAPQCNWWHFRLFCSRRITGVQHLRSLRAMGALQRRNVQWRRPSPSNLEEETDGSGGLFPRPQPHKGPCRCLHHSSSCLGKDSEPHADFSGFRELLHFSDILTWQGSASARWMSSPALMTQVSATHMEWSASRIWSKPSFMIHIKTEVVNKTTGALQYVSIKAGKTQITALPGSLLEAFGDRGSNFNIRNADVGKGS